MPTDQRLRDLLRLSVQFAACLALGAACGDGSTMPASERKSPRASDAAPVCPECSRMDDSSASAGSVAACSLAYLKRSIDQSEAEMLGFPVTAAAALIEQPIDEAMTWVPKESEVGGPATGYKTETRIRGAFEVESYDYGWLDPERCDGTVCRLEDGHTTEQAPCDERYLMMRVSGSLETLDGAIAAEFPAQAVNLRRPGQTDDLVVAAAADLSEVRGSLKLDPRVPAPRAGRLDLSLQFADSKHRGFGVVSVSVFPDWDNLAQGAGTNIPRGFAYYDPIEGHWGDPLMDSPKTAGSESR